MQGTVFQENNLIKLNEYKSVILIRQPRYYKSLINNS